MIITENYGPSFTDLQCHMYSSGQKKVAVPFSFYDCRTVDRALIVRATNDSLTLLQLAHSCVRTIELPFCARSWS